jgi:hypothetical protein
MFRGLIEAIVLAPEKGQLRIELRGNLAAMLTAAEKTVQLVAGGVQPVVLAVVRHG